MYHILDDFRCFINDLLAVPASQLSLLAEVRTLIAPHDLERFDGQVLHREMEAWRARHGGPGLLHPDSICVTHPEGHIPSAGQLTPAVSCYKARRMKHLKACFCALTADFHSCHNPIISLNILLLGI